MAASTPVVSAVSTPSGDPPSPAVYGVWEMNGAQRPIHADPRRLTHPFGSAYWLSLWDAQVHAALATWPEATRLDIDDLAEILPEDAGYAAVSDDEAATLTRAQRVQRGRRRIVTDALRRKPQARPSE
jgi:hypothetical protein